MKKCFDNLYDASLKDANSHRDGIVVCAKYWDVNETIALGTIFAYFHVKFIYWDKTERETEFPYKITSPPDHYGQIVKNELDDIVVDIRF